MKNFDIEIYEPNTTSDVLFTAESDQPFSSISKGDLINPRLFPNFDYNGQILKVRNIEHMVWETAGVVKHKICIFTEPVEDSPETRLK